MYVSRSIIKDVLNGIYNLVFRRKKTSLQSNRRKSICRRCKSYKPSIIGGNCKICSCFIAIKARCFTDSNMCPSELWYDNELLAIKDFGDIRAERTNRIRAVYEVLRCTDRCFTLNTVKDILENLNEPIDFYTHYGHIVPQSEYKKIHKKILLAMNAIKFIENRDYK